MQRYWLRIALGALVVFALGMTAISIYRSGAKKVETLANSADPITIPLAILPFQVDGDRLGKIQEVQIRRDAPKRVSGIGLVVKMSDSAATEDLLSACLITVNDHPSDHRAPSFHCATPADSLADSLTAFGEVRFEPGGVVRGFFLPARVVGDWREGRSELISFEAERRVAHSRSRAVIRVDNDSGDTVFELHADSAGARLRVRDDSGRDVLRMDADSTGARLMVRDDSAPRKPRR
ncbi:MAG: hypothetical protein ACREOC_13685 [Gemmatimonadales bacterium]